MKSPPAVVDDCDDIFGPPRTYPTGYSPPKTRPSMISAKYRQKEERRKVLKISINKLKKIEDPEASLCRSVLINNTMKRLQKEARDEKMQKQQLNYPRCFDTDNILNIKNEFIKNENKTFEDEEHSFNDSNVEMVVENDFDTKLAEEINAVNAKSAEILSSIDNNFTTNNNNNNNNHTGSATSVLATATENSDRFSQRKRSFDDLEDCDVQDVLSQFYMPPTPRMLTCIDDDDDVNNVVGGNEPCAKRLKIEINDFVDQQQQQQQQQEQEKQQQSDFSASSHSVNFINNSSTDNTTTTTTTATARLRFPNQNEDSNPYSCGHASMFNELQSNHYHNLIASLET